MTANVFVFDPTAPCSPQKQPPLNTLSSMNGKVVGFVDNGKPNFSDLVDDLAELLKRRYGVKSIVKHSKHMASIPAADEIMKSLTGQCDLVITGSGD